MVGSFAEIQCVQHLAVASFVMPLEVLQQAASTADHHEEALAGVHIFLVGLEVIGQAVDALGQERNLHLGRPGVLLVLLKSLHECLPL